MNIKQTVAEAASVRVIVLVNYFSLFADRSRGIGELKKILTSATRSGSADAKKRAESQKIVEGQKGKGKPKAAK